MLSVTSPANRLTGAKSTTAQPSLRAIVFPIDSYLFALPIKAVFKIIPCPPIDSPIEDCIGLVEWEGKAVTVVDLSQKLSTDLFESSKIPSQKSFLILTQTNDGEFFGFLTEESPTLIDIPLNDVHSLPQSYRDVNKLGFVSHMALLASEETKQTLKIFLLGIEF